MNVVFNSNPTPFRNIHSRFDGNDRTNRKHLLRHTRQPGGLVHLQADPVPQAMPKLLTKATRVQHRPRERVTFSSAHTRMNAQPSDLVCVAHRIVGLALTTVGMRNYHRSGHI